MANDVTLRGVQDSDLPIFFEQQLDPEATRMAAFPARPRDAFMAHWEKILTGASPMPKTIVFQGNVAGNIVCWEQHDERNVGYWLGKEYWGKGVASAALSQFLEEVKVRPLSARVAKHNAASIRVLQKCGFKISGEDRFPGVKGEEGEEFILTLRASGGEGQ
jgi:RimJ/RimL family protein N-acetyltransferase